MKASFTNSFASYELTPDEQIQSQIFGALNVAFLKNQLCQIAEEKINLEFTPNDVLSFTQQEAYLKGQMDMLKYLLACHEESQQSHTITTKE